MLYWPSRPNIDATAGLDSYRQLFTTGETETSGKQVRYIRANNSQWLWWSFFVPSVMYMVTCNKYERCDHSYEYELKLLCGGWTEERSHVLFVTKELARLSRFTHGLLESLTGTQNLRRSIGFGLAVHSDGFAYCSRRSTTISIAKSNLTRFSKLQKQTSLNGQLTCSSLCEVGNPPSIWGAAILDW